MPRLKAFLMPAECEHFEVAWVYMRSQLSKVDMKKLNDCFTDKVVINKVITLC